MKTLDEAIAEISAYAAGITSHISVDAAEQAYYAMIHLRDGTVRANSAGEITESGIFRTENWSG